MSAALVRGLSAGFQPAHEENKKSGMKKSCSEIGLSQEGKEV